MPGAGPRERSSSGPRPHDGDRLLTKAEAEQLTRELGRCTTNFFVQGEFQHKLAKGMTLKKAEEYVSGQREASERASRIDLLRRIASNPGELERVRRTDPTLAAEVLERQRIDDRRSFFGPAAMKPSTTSDPGIISAPGGER